jgi:hypothetical protein
MRWLQDRLSSSHAGFRFARPFGKPLASTVAHGASARLIGQCPGCFSIHKVPDGVDWECDCGELVTIIDLRAKRASIDRPAGTPEAEHGWGAGPDTLHMPSEAPKGEGE